MQKIREALSLLLSEKWYCTVDERAVGLCVSIGGGGEGELMQRLQTEEMGRIVIWCFSWKRDKDSVSLVEEQ